MSKMIRIGIVGCGGIARAHVKGYKNNQGVHIAAVYDVMSQAAEKLARETDACVAKSLDEMARAGDLDAVSICSPPAAHLDNCIPFLRAGIGVLCEKPLEVNAVKAIRLAALARRSRSVFMTAFCHRFHPAIIELKGLIDRGVLGRPLLFRNLFGGYLPLKGNHRADPALSGGGCLVDHCAHSVDLFRFLAGGNEWKPVDCAKHPDRFTGEVRHFLDCVRGRRKPAITAEDGFKAVCIARDIYRSVSSKKRIPITYR